jgi:hypothetical protein
VTRLTFTIKEGCWRVILRGVMRARPAKPVYLPEWHFLSELLGIATSLGAGTFHAHLRSEIISRFPKQAREWPN